MNKLMNNKPSDPNGEGVEIAKRLGVRDENDDIKSQLQGIIDKIKEEVDEEKKLQLWDMYMA